LLVEAPQIADAYARAAGACIELIAELQQIILGDFIEVYVDQDFGLALIQRGDELFDQL